MDFKLLEEAAREWESYARDLDDWRKKNLRQATWRSSREARSDARRIRRMLPLVGLEVELTRPTRAGGEEE